MALIVRLNGVKRNRAVLVPETLDDCRRDDFLVLASVRRCQLYGHFFDQGRLWLKQLRRKHLKQALLEIRPPDFAEGHPGG